MNEIYDQLNDLYKLQIAASEIRHGIMREQWRLFEPSKFVYAFFAFNSFYSIDWIRSADEQKLVKWELTGAQTGGDTVAKTESQKVSELRRFVSKTIIDDAKVDFAKELSKKLIHYLGEDAQSTIEILKGITTDNNIDEKRKAQFIIEYEHLLRHELKGKKLNDALDIVLKFSLSVRNNIFHGTKTVIDMMHKGQQDRLKVYTSILLAVNELLFDAIEIRFEWTRKQIRFDLSVINRKRINPVNNRIYRDTIASRFGVIIPDGPLFYPCCGDDTREPIKLFIDSVSEFHFVDSRMIPPFPLTETIANERRMEDYSRGQNACNRHVLFSQEIVSKTTVHSAAQDDLNIKLIDDLKCKGIRFAEYKNQSGIIYKQDWDLLNDEKKLSIYCHKQDGLATFTSIEKIAVFFLRRDSEGEGGSGQRWFQKKVFDLILDKLVDKGLIVTDGSGLDPEIFDIAEWKSLWANSSVNRHERDNESLPQNFEYSNRKFDCIGKCGMGYGPLYLWRVSNIIY